MARSTIPASGKDQCHLQPPPLAAVSHHSGEFSVLKKKKNLKEAKDAHKRGRSCPPKEAKVAHFIFLAFSWLVGS
jgi:hypothetical protein